LIIDEIPELYADFSRLVFDTLEEDQRFNRLNFKRQLKLDFTNASDLPSLNLNTTL